MSSTSMLVWMYRWKCIRNFLRDDNLCVKSWFCLHSDFRSSCVHFQTWIYQHGQGMQNYLFADSFEQKWMDNCKLFMFCILLRFSWDLVSAHADFIVAVWHLVCSKSLHRMIILFLIPIFSMIFSSFWILGQGLKISKFYKLSTNT